jgi:excisionase family DNA binding protein
VEALTISVNEAAQLLGLSPNHCWRLIQSGELPSMRLGRRVLVPRRALEQLVEMAASRRPAATAIR